MHGLYIHGWTCMGGSIYIGDPSYYIVIIDLDNNWMICVIARGLN